MSADLNRSKNKYHVGEEVFFNLAADDPFVDFNGKSGKVTQVIALPAGEGFLYTVLTEQPGPRPRIELLAYESELLDEAPGAPSSKPSLQERLAAFSAEELKSELDRRAHVLRTVVTSGRPS